MKLQITGIGIELTPALKQYIEERIGGLAHFLGEGKAVHAVVEVGRASRHHKHDHVMFAAVNMQAGGKLFRAEAAMPDARAAVDVVRDELYREINKFKGKRETLFRRGARSIKKLLRLSPLARFRKSKVETE